MNNATATRLPAHPVSPPSRPRSPVTGVVLVASPATATTDVPSGGVTAQGSGSFDIANYVAHRKALWAQEPGSTTPGSTAETTRPSPFRRGRRSQCRPRRAGPRRRRHSGVVGP